MPQQRILFFQVTTEFFYVFPVSVVMALLSSLPGLLQAAVRQREVPLPSAVDGEVTSFRPLSAVSNQQSYFTFLSNSSAACDRAH